MCTEMGMEGSLCRPPTIGVPGDRVAGRVLQVAGWAVLLQLIWRGREGCHFPGANPTVLFPFRETTDRELSITLGT